MSKKMKIGKRGITAIAASSAIAFLSVLGAGSAYAVWSDTGHSKALVVEDAPVMARVGTAVSEGKPSTAVSYDNTTRNFWGAPQSEVLGVKTQETGVASWPVTAHAYNPINSDSGRSTMSLAVTARKSSPWSKAKFTLVGGKCAGEPSGLDEGKALDKANHSAFLTTFSNGNGDEDSKFCLWAKLPTEESKTYTSSGEGENANTGDLLSDENKENSDAGYSNDITVDATGVISKTPVSDNDKWTVKFKRFPNPKDGDVTLLFRPEATTGVCE